VCRGVLAAGVELVVVLEGGGEGSTACCYDSHGCLLLLGLIVQYCTLP
jgi:hypothetical protein